MKVEKTDERIYISFDRIEDTIARVYVNGNLAGIVPWEPYTVDITELIRDGENTITMELVTTRHNLFGPHHNKTGEVRKFCAPHIWTNEVMWTDDYFFVPVGVVGGKILFN
ncbi:MAG: hypothetical protein SOX32_11515 [Candidatus Choladocola sp.]|nr:hypothetical protein [Candidatus Choladocola sp.]